MYGRFSKEWNAQQKRYLIARGAKLTRENNGPGWLSNIIVTIWNRVHTEWNTRNAARHGKDDATRQALKLELARREISHLYTLKNRCLYRDRTTIFFSSPEIHFQRQPKYHQLRAWIDSQEPVIKDSVARHAQNLINTQTAISDFFPDHPG